MVRRDCDCLSDVECLQKRLWICSAVCSVRRRAAEIMRLSTEWKVAAAENLDI